MRPAGPVPRTWRRSMPASRARRRTAGEASGFSPGGRGGPSGARATGAAARRRRRLGGLRAGGDGRCAAAAPAAAAAGRRCFARRGRHFGIALARDLQATSSAPTASTLPTSPPSATTLPATGEGISTVALSVMTAARSWSSSTDWPTSTCHSTSSASATPSPTSGSLMMRMPISGLHHGLERTADPGGAGEIVPFLGMRIGRVPAGDPHDRRLEMIEAVLLHQRAQLARRSPRSGSPRARRRSGRSSSPRRRSSRGRRAPACADR